MELKRAALRAIEVLWQRRAQVDTPDLIRNLEHPDADVRANTASQLAYYGEQAAPAAENLVELLNDPDGEVQRAAAFALSAIGPAGLDGIKSGLMAASSDASLKLFNILISFGDAAEPAAEAVRQKILRGDLEPNALTAARSLLFNIGVETKMSQKKKKAVWSSPEHGLTLETMQENTKRLYDRTTPLGMHDADDGDLGWRDVVDAIGDDGWENAQPGTPQLPDAQERASILDPYWYVERIWQGLRDRSYNDAQQGFEMEMRKPTGVHLSDDQKHKIALIGLDWGLDLGYDGIEQTAMKKSVEEVWEKKAKKAQLGQQYKFEIVVNVTDPEEMTEEMLGEGVYSHFLEMGEVWPVDVVSFAMNKA